MDKEHCMLDARILQAQGKTQAEIAQALARLRSNAESQLVAQTQARQL